MKNYYHYLIARMYILIAHHQKDTNKWAYWIDRSTNEIVKMFR